MNRLCVCCAVCFTFLQLGGAGLSAQPPQEHATLKGFLQNAIERERIDKALHALSVILVNDQKTVWEAGFGEARPKTRASAETIYRVGSVSKLFTDIALMQLVEQKRVDLDAPVSRYLPDFHPINRFYKSEITLRQLMTHRSGLVREPPVGHYFDPTRPTISATVASLNQTELIYPPGQKTKYSNAGITVVGEVIEKLTGKPFSESMTEAVLDPLGCSSSSFTLSKQVGANLAAGQMWTYYGRTFAAPTFPLGIEPAGNLYTTVGDLGSFLSMLFAGGKGRNGQILQPQTLEDMYLVQFEPPGTKSGFGLGFDVHDFHGRRCVGHNGAVYGFATVLEALPAEKLGVAVVTTKDCANGVAKKLADYALALMLANREGKELPVYEPARPVEAGPAWQMVGTYSTNGEGVDLFERDGKLYAWPITGGPRLELHPKGAGYEADGPLEYGQAIRIEKNPFLLFGEKASSKASLRKPDPAPARWMSLIGEYGWDHDVLFILEKEGRLFALIEWFFLYPLEELSNDVFRFPGKGLYENEKLIFKRNSAGKVLEVNAASVVFKRRPLADEGQTFRITPRRSIDVIRQEALAAKPPAERGYFEKSDLVDLTSLDPTILLDIRYASTNNFMSVPLYTSARAFMQRPAAESVVRAHHELAKQGFGLLIHDAYRPWYVTKMFWEATPDAERIFVADPSQGSRHNRGCAVDLTLYDLKTKKPIVMVGGYDEFSDRSFPGYLGGTSLQRWHEQVLRNAMEKQGFKVYENEWWHFDFRDWKKYPIHNVTFENLGKPQ
jgi:CubicO group peptidase (beta-lactamase class C family)/D-alanyl-D-alanine dipeptidase